MSEAELPEDVEQWPSDPFRLLGVNYGVDQKSLKRVYSRLIKRFKPDHHPEQFRRIREAYERLLRFAPEKPQPEVPTASAQDPEEKTVEWDSSTASLFLTLPPEKTTEPQTEAPANDSKPEKSPAPPRPASFEQLIEAFWEETATGERESGYRRLAELHWQRPGHEDLCVRLYWLLNLWPTLDEQRAAADWLAEGMKQHGLRGRLGDLYRVLLEERPQEAVSQRCTGLLALATSPGQVLDWYKLRWRWAARQDQFRLMSDDLDLLQGKFAHHEPQDWVLLLLNAIECLIWERSPKAQAVLAKCKKWLSEYPELQLRLDDELSKLEIAEEIAAEYIKQGEDVAPSCRLLSLISASWRQPLAQIYPLLTEELGRLIELPRKGLERLDQLHQQFPTSMIRLGELLAGLPEPWQPYQAPPTSEIIESLITSRLQVATITTYADIRFTLLDFCLHEMLPPDVIQNWSGERDSYPHRIMSSGLHKDVPLRYFFEAYRKLWA